MKKTGRCGGERYDAIMQRNKKVVIIFILYVINLIIFSTNSFCITDKLNLYLKLDEGSGSVSYDTSNYSNTALLFQGSWTNQYTRTEDGIYFDGQDDYLKSGCSGFSKQDGSIEFWLSPAWQGNDNKFHILYDNSNISAKTWQDDFQDTSLLDLNNSKNIEVQDGKIQLKKI